MIFCIILNIPFAALTASNIANFISSPPAQFLYMLFQFSLATKLQ